MPWTETAGGYTKARRDGDERPGGFVTNPAQYEALRRKGMSKKRAAAITNSHPVAKSGDRWAGEASGFNRTAAETVYKALVGMDADSALVFGRMLTAEALRHELITKRHQIAKALLTEEHARIETLRSRLARDAVSKARTGNAAAELEALVVLAKDFEYSTAQRREYTRRQQRDLATGRFAESHVKIGYDSKLKPLDAAHAQQFGIPKPSHLDGKDLAAFQQAYQQVRDLVSPYAHAGADNADALLHLHIASKDGQTRTGIAAIEADGKPMISHDLQPGDRLLSASVSVAPQMSAGGAYYDMLAGLGAPRAGATAAGATSGGVLDPTRLSEYRGQLDRQLEQEDYIPSRRVFHNLESGSKLLEDSFGDVAPRHVQYALKVGQHVGRLGPEAQKVIGPTADRVAYRYRGTERPVSPVLGAQVNYIGRGDFAPVLDRLPSQMSVEDKREFMLHGSIDRETNKWVPSGVLGYFRRELPSPNLNSLQLKAGNVPPSRGIILNAQGEVAHESVGFGDDWYLPFNLRNLKALRGGEYIRTRTYGGPTTEDIYTALMSGAHGLTVVSHNGSYTVEFSDDLRGGRRFNDKALRMTGRYGHLLDAVRHGQVEQAGLHPSRIDELREKVPYDEDDPQFGPELTKLVNRERKNPTLSRQQQIEASLSFFNRYAERSGDDARQVTNPQQLVDTYVNAAARHAYAEHVKAAKSMGVATGRSLADYEREERNRLSDPDPVRAAQNVADALGIRPQLDAAMTQAERENKASVKLLELNGAGYKAALDALQEQFPQYISRVEFHPWEDAGEALDTGYVRPRHARAAGALSGYFDEHANRGEKRKVYADSTRYQNHNRTVREYQPRSGERNQDTTGTTGGGGRTTTAAGKPAELTPEMAAGLRADADKAMFAAFHAPDAKISAGITHATVKPEMAAGRPVKALAADPGFGQAFPAIDRLLKMTPTEFDALYTREPDRARAMVTEAKAENDRHRVLDVPAEVESDFERGGLPSEARKPNAEAREDLDHLDSDFDLAHLGPAYLASGRPNADLVARAYRANPRITALVEKGHLPDNVADSDFPAKAAALRTQLGVQQKAIRADIRRGVYPTAAEKQAVNRPAEGLREALQLRRRHDEDIERAARVAPPQAEAPARNETQVVMPPRQEWESPEEYARTQASLLEEVRRKMAAERDDPNNSRTIEG